MNLTGLRASRTACGFTLNAVASSSRVRLPSSARVLSVSAAASAESRGLSTRAARPPCAPRVVRLPLGVSFSTSAPRFDPSKAAPPPPPPPPPPPTPPTAPTAPTAPASSSSAPINPDIATAQVSEKKQALTDWTILRQLAQNVWPKGNNSVKVRVVGALTLLVAGKVLNVQVPFFFKAIVDGLNIPITSDTAVWTIAGASILGCESGRVELLCSHLTNMQTASRVSAPRALASSVTPSSRPSRRGPSARSRARRSATSSTWT
jgi:ABC transporter ATM